MDKIQSRYINELCNLSVAPAFFELKIFPNGKEITESFAAYHAVRTHLPNFSLRDPSITLIAVGDGSTPRTAVTFALRSAWTCYSVDPVVHVPRKMNHPALQERLKICPDMIEHTMIDADRAVIVAVHSHAKLDVALNSVRAKEVAIVALPCCVPQVLSRKPDIEYVDENVWSPQRTVKIWKS